ncbi:MAG: CBS domain-containing protein [Nitrospiraceae bacterium]
MSVVGVPVGGLKTVGQIVATNTLTFQEGQDGLAIAVALVSSHTPGAPVVDSSGKYLGFINEFDVMRALDGGKDLSKLTAEELMRKDRLAVTASTKIADAAKKMEEHSVLNLPVERNGKVAYSVSRHDLLRAWIGLGLGMGIDP